MFAIVEIAGTQVKVEPKQKVYVPKLNSEAGSTIKFDKVLLTENENEVKIGTPYINGSYVEAKVIGHLKDEKVLVFKKKRRKGYKVKRGHRQQYSEIEITKIV